MQKQELNEILHAIKYYSGEITGKITKLVERMEEHFERLETKFTRNRVLSLQ
ncbi:hypothetical protein [Virgibacillus halodenitrificans]|uniref:hypothetical protein n=1 Tax=Virgibacillus halodenitrificans TaxID=1482 RepID=UPI001F386AE4|nr:hypothetical protein [Virgibacillus halodenitrificans]